MITLAGGGAIALARLLTVPGASKTVLAADVPYSAEALRSALLEEPDHAVTEDLAREMAALAYRRAVALGESCAGRPFGLAVTAALATDPPRRGNDRAWIALRTAREVDMVHMCFDKAGGSRTQQEEDLADLILAVLAEACDGDAMDVARFGPGIERSKCAVADPIEDLLAGECRWLTLSADGRMVREGGVAAVLLSGSFNPLHAGHSRLLESAGAWCGGPGALELSIENADKPRLDRAGLMERLESIRGRHPVVITCAATFEEKARLFPGVAFVVGVDTWVRVVDPAYYGGDEALAAALAMFTELGTRFLVAGRQGEGVWRAGDVVPIPRAIAGQVTFLSREQFEAEHASTVIRRHRR